MSSPIVLVLGAGPGIGANVMSYFATKGYRVALGARSLSDRRKGEHLELHIDLTQPETVPSVFDRVEQELGCPPSVVIYNAAALTLSPEEDPLSTFVFADYQRDLSVNLHSAVAAAQEAVRGFSRLPEASSKTFIYTGNKLNVMSDPKVFSFGIARTGAAHFIWDCSIAYRHKGYKFYYTDERLEDGSPSRGLMDPTARAVLYHQISEDVDQGPWLYTFVKDHGYKSFEASDQPWSVS